MSVCQYFQNGTVIHNGRSLLPTTGLLVGAGEVIWPAQPHPAHQSLVKTAMPYDLKGRCISPGFIDNSLSLIHLGELLTRTRDLRHIRSAAELREFLWQQPLKNPKQTCFWGTNLDIREGRPATAADLDLAFPDRPAILFSKGEKTALVNSFLLKISRLAGDGLVRGGKNVIRNGGPGVGLFMTGQKIFRQSELENGLLPKEQHSQALSVLPKPTREERVEMLLAAQRMALRLGITCAFEPEISTEWMDILQEMEQRGLLWMRVRGSFAWEKKADWTRFEQGQKTDWLRVDTIRLTLKGVMFEDDWELFKEKAWEIHRRGWRIAVSAFDTPTLEAVLTFFEKMSKTMPYRQPRHRVEHFGCPTEKHLERAAKLGLGIVVKMEHLAEPKSNVLKFLNEKKPSAWMPMADIFRQNLPISIASGGPDHAMLSPLKTLETAINGPVLTNFQGKSQGLSRGMALWAHTRLAAIVNGEGDKLGNLELATRPKNPVPFMADFLIFDKNPLDHPPADLMLLATFVEGVCRWASPILLDEQPWFAPVQPTELVE